MEQANNNARNLYIWISIFLYALCLILTPTFYVGASQEHQGGGLSLLLMGWMGVFYGHYSWLANPLYIIGLFNLRNPASSLFLSLALLFALSFLLHKEIAVSEAPSYANISGYGVGYYLWVMAIGILLFGKQLSDAPIKKQLKFILAWCTICSATFVYHYFFSEQAHHKLIAERERAFEKACESAHYSIYKQNEVADSIYYEPAVNVQITHGEKGSNLTGFGRAGYGSVNSGLIEFYERNNDKYHKDEQPKSKFIRSYYDKEKRRIQEIEADEVLSTHSVKTEHFKLAKNLNISHSKVTITNNSNGEVIAETEYAVDKNNHLFCNGTTSTTFNTSRFIMSALNLSKRFASGYEKYYKNKQSAKNKSASQQPL